MWWLIQTGTPTRLPIFAVSSIEAQTRSASSLGDRDHLIGRRMHVGRVVEAGGEARGTLGQRVLQPQAHVLDLGILRRAHHVAVHGLHAQGLVADQGVGVHLRPALLQLMRVVAEGIEPPPALLPDQVERRRRQALEARGGERDAAIADDDRGDALAELAGHAVGPAQHGAVVMGVGVDEAGGERLALRHHLPVRAGAAEVADGDDAVAADADIAAPGRRARAVEDGGITDDEVAAQRHGRKS